MEIQKIIELLIRQYARTATFGPTTLLAEQRNFIVGFFMLIANHKSKKNTAPEFLFGDGKRKINNPLSATVNKDYFVFETLSVGNPNVIIRFKWPTENLLYEAVELGVSTINGFVTAECLILPDGENQPKPIEDWGLVFEEFSRVIGKYITA